jgi:hypothetical protein
MTELKTQKNKAGVLEFLKKNPDPIQKQDALALLEMMKEITGEKPVMWGEAMVGFGEYHYKSEKSSQEGDWPLTAFSPRKQNLTVYIMAGFKGHEALLKKLGKYKISGGSCLYIKRLPDIHLPTLKKIIERGYKTMKKRYAA